MGAIAVEKGCLGTVEQVELGFLGLDLGLTLVQVAKADWLRDALPSTGLHSSCPVRRAVQSPAPGWPGSMDPWEPKPWTMRVRMEKGGQGGALSPLEPEESSGT